MAEDASSFVMKREILGIDLLRFSAALMVLGFHVGFWGFHAPPQVLEAMLGSPDIGNLLESYTKFGWVGVEIFFVISGFIIAYSAEGTTPDSFFRGRLLRLMPCVWFACLMCIPMAYFIEQYPVALIIKLLVKSMLLYPKGPWIEAVLWTLVVEVAFYAVIFLLILTNWLKHIDLVGSLIGLCSACYWILEGLMLRSPRYAALARQMGDFSWSPAAQVSLIHHGCFFGIGIGLWLLLIKRRLGITVVLAPVMLVGCYYEILHTGFTEFQATAIAQSSIVPFAVWLGSLVVIVVSVNQDAMTKRFFSALGVNVPARVKWCGGLTYPLYLLHVPTVLLTIACAPLSLGPYLRWTCGICTALIIAAIFSTFIEPRLKRALGQLVDLLLEFPGRSR